MIIGKVLKMQKIPMLFALEFDERGVGSVTDKVNPKAEFIFDREDAIPTMKIDGTAVLFDENGEWFARRAVKKGKNEPNGFVLAEEDKTTGNKFGWEPIEQSAFAKFFRKALANAGEDAIFEPGTTWELIGPKINGNPENVDRDMLVRHGCNTPQDSGFDFPTIAEMREQADNGNLFEFMTPFFTDFKATNKEGVVWWIDNAPVVKLRVKDFYPEMDPRNNRKR